MNFFKKLMAVLPAIFSVVQGIVQGISSWRNPSDGKPPLDKK